MRSKRLRALLAGMLVVAFAPTVGAAEKSTGAGSGKGIVWHKGDVLTALQTAKAANKPLLIKFTAAWCTYCHALEQEVLNTPKGAALTAGMVAVKVDFDAPENRRFVEKYVVLGLPTSIVVKASGEEAGRIMGYESKKAYTVALKGLRSGGVSLARLEAQRNAHPKDPSVLRQLGQALLERGSPARGQAILGQVTWLAPTSDAAAHALFVLGRYFHRVKQEPETARHIWRELASRFPRSSWAPGALWWYARAQAEVGQPLTGAYSLEHTARQTKKLPAQMRAAASWGAFVVKHKLKSRGPVVLAFLKALAKKSPGAAASHAALKAQLEGLAR